MQLRSGRKNPGLARLGLFLALSLAAITLYLVWQWLGGWDALLLWVLSTQQSLHQQLVVALRAVSQHGASAAPSLIGLSVLYGIFHAAGPGHGKAVIATYLGTHAVQMRRGVLLSVISSLAQGVMAIVLVEVTITVLGISLRQAQGVSMQAETLSFALVSLMGLLLTVRSLRTLHRRWRAAHRPALFSANTRTLRAVPASTCIDCERAHGPSRAQLEQALSWRTSAGIVLSIGVRPCTGAILVMLVAHTAGLRWTAIASVLAMSLGTAATVAVLALISVSARHIAIRLLRPAGQSSKHAALTLALLGVAGGVFILLMGVGLLQQGLRMAAHPLLP